MMIAARQRSRARRLDRWRAGAPLVACLVAAAAPARALAVDCHTLPQPVFVVGSTAAKPLLAQIGRVVASAAKPTTVIYQGQGSCAGVDAILNGTAVYGEGATALSYWDASGTEQPCDLAAAGPGATADVGLSDVFASTCVDLPGGLPSNVADFVGPVQTMTFVVPAASTERSISAAAAYNVFAFGADSGVTPWTNRSLILQRDPTSGTQRMIAVALGVPVDRWSGTPVPSSGAMLSTLTSASPGGAAIGILAADVAQDNRAALAILAYQHFDQTCGYYPDRDAASNEKSNVRDGHYAIWGPLHLLSRIGVNGLPLNAGAADLIGFMTGTTPAPAGLDLISVEAQHHVVPRCAMRVNRVQEMGALSSYAPPGSCGCAYEKAANGATACMPCQTDRDCPGTAPVCSYRYCETQ